MLYILLLLIVCLKSSSYTLVDTQCVIGAQNRLGSMHITHNLIGDQLALYFDFRDPTTLYPCNLSLANQPYSLVMRNTTGRIATLDNENRILVYRESIRTTGNNNTVLFKLDKACTRLVKLLVVIDVILIVNKTSHNITLTAYPDALNDNGVNCSIDTRYSKMGFSCSTTPLLQPIGYQLNNCLATEDDKLVVVVANRTQQRKVYSPLYWYAQYLTNERMQPGSNMTLCGEPLQTILYRSDLYMSVCQKRPLRSDWYRLAIQVVTVAFNGLEEKYDWIWLHGLEVLERHCHAKEGQFAGTAVGEDSLFLVILERLTEANRIDVARAGTDNKPLMCAQIHAYFERHYNETMSEMLFNQWYYKGFRLILMPNQDMELYAILLVVLFCSIPIVLFVLLGHAIYRAKFLRKVRIL